MGPFNQSSQCSQHVITGSRHPCLQCFKTRSLNSLITNSISSATSSLVCSLFGQAALSFRSSTSTFNLSLICLHPYILLQWFKRIYSIIHIWALYSRTISHSSRPSSSSPSSFGLVSPTPENNVNRWEEYKLASHTILCNPISPISKKYFNIFRVCLGEGGFFGVLGIEAILMRVRYILVK